MNIQLSLLKSQLRLVLADSGKNHQEKFHITPKIRRELINNFEFLEGDQKIQKSILNTNYGKTVGNNIFNILTKCDNKKIQETIKWGSEKSNHLIFINDDKYPLRLKEIDDAPILLYVKGNLELLNTPAISIVGSRSATSYGIRLAEEFASQLSASGITIISGLALGIDSAAHQGAMQNDSNATIGILGTGANIIYPKKSIKLAREMAEKALIITEFPLNTAPRPFNFPKRNRIIAALSLGCLVIEASFRSGALITAKLAADYGVDIFAIPGSVHSPLSRGTHKLIREGAKLVETTNDILEELHSQIIPLIKSKSSETKISNEQVNNNEIINKDILNLIPYSPTLIDELVTKSNLEIGEIHSQLLNLEMQGFIESLPGSRFQRIK